MLSVIILIVTAPQVNPFQATRIQAYFLVIYYYYAECRNTECPYAD